MNRPRSLLASVFGFLGQVVAHEERSLEQLDADDGEDELKEQVDDHDDEDVLDGVDDAVEHRLTARQRARSTDDDRPTTLHGDLRRLNYFISFQTWFHAEVKLFQTRAAAVGRPP